MIIAVTAQPSSPKVPPGPLHLHSLMPIRLSSPSLCKSSMTMIPSSQGTAVDPSVVSCLTCTRSVYKQAAASHRSPPLRNRFECPSAPCHRESSTALPDVARLRCSTRRSSAASFPCLGRYRHYNPRPSVNGMEIVDLHLSRSSARL